MNRLANLGQLILGDFRERTRRYSFLWILMFTTFFGYLVITDKYTMIFVDYTTATSSAWVGSVMAIFCTILLSMVGFYLIRKTVERDRRTGVGQILAATPVPNLTYLTSKFISNYLVLLACMSILIVAAVIMQLLGGLAEGFSSFDILIPFLVITCPVLVMVAGLAVVFESVKWLQGTVGNVLYLFLMEMAIVHTIALDQPLFDLVGAHQFTTSVKQAILAAYPGASIGIQVGLAEAFEGVNQIAAAPFSWTGIDWSLDMFWPRLNYVGIGLVAVLGTTLFFDRFDPARVAPRFKKRKKAKEAAKAIPVVESIPTVGILQTITVSPTFSMFSMVVAEIRLMLKGYHWTWYLIALGLVVAEAAAPIEIARKYILPAALIWPLPLWSAMGTREMRFNTGPLLLSSASPLARQFPAIWLSGVVITLLSLSGIIVKAGLVGNPALVGALLGAVLFIPTAAMTLGSLSGTRKIFEVVYSLVWYIGCVNRLAAMDFAGVTNESLALGIPVVYLAITGVMLPVSFLVGRYRTATA